MNKRNSKFAGVLVFLMVGLVTFWAYTFIVAMPEEEDVLKFDANTVALFWSTAVVVNEINCIDIDKQMFRLGVDWNVTDENKEIMLDGMRVFKSKCVEAGY